MIPKTRSACASKPANELLDLHVIMTTHNRSEITSRGLWRLRNLQANGANINLHLVDAGSTDGTVEKALQIFPAAQITVEKSNVFWAEGMAQAEKQVLESKEINNSDLLLWLNDDVILDHDSLVRLLNESERLREDPAEILIGAMRSGTGEITYGGLQRSRLNPLKFKLYTHVAEETLVKTFHGNLVLLTVGRAREIGGIDGGFGHHRADLDYGLRNSDLGGKNTLLGGTFGICENRRDAPPTRRKAWFHYRSILGSGHRESRKRFLRKHPSPLGRLFSIAADAKFLLKLVFVRN